MLTLRLAFRNALRQGRRTALTALTMFGGFTLAAVSIGWAGGTYSHTIDMFTRNRLGHIQVHHQGYVDHPSLYATINDYAGVGQTIERIPEVEAWAPRLYSGGLASVGEKSAGVQVVGTDPVRETETTRFDKKIVRGRMFTSASSPEAILGVGLARILRADNGDEVVIVSQAADGSIANDVYQVIGIATTGDDVTDRMALYLPLKTAQELLVLHGRVHEIAVVIDDLDHVGRVTGKIAEHLQGADLAVDPWYEFARSFYRAMKADKEGMWIMLLVILIVVAIGVLNTVLMSVLERIREYGVMRALGTRPRQIVAVVLCEIAFIALTSIVVGSGAGLLVNSILSRRGIPLPAPFTYGGMEFTKLMTEVDAESLYIPAVTIFLSALLVGLFPSVRAARTEPARAMRIF